MKHVAVTASAVGPSRPSKPRPNHEAAREESPTTSPLFDVTVTRASRVTSIVVSPVEHVHTTTSEPSRTSSSKASSSSVAASSVASVAADGSDGSADGSVVAKPAMAAADTSTDGTLVPNAAGSEPPPPSLAWRRPGPAQTTSFPAASIATRSPSHSHSLTPGDVNSLFGFRHASETGGPSDVDGASSGASRLSVRSVLGSNSAIVAPPFASTQAAATHVAFSLSDERRIHSAVTRLPCRPIARLETHGEALDALHAHTTPSSPALTTTPSRRTHNALTLSV
mmetsp:Transcript_2722/g.12321  ORF Transcript_2722/g.12321 Transcript_2722/m.12321 type:complete len:282 (+) Transcript_2722:3260-4105(+)